MKEFTLPTLSHRFSLLAALFMVAFAAQAGDQLFYYFSVHTEAYPTGKGKVYMSDSEDENKDSYAESQDYNFISENYTTSPTSARWFFAQASEGVQFVGWSADKKTLISTDTSNPQMIYIMPKTEGFEDGIDSPLRYPLEPDTTLYAVFGCVNAQYIPGEEGMGAITLSNIANTKGETLTLTATEADNRCHFTHWTNKDGERFTDNPLTTTVQGIDTYTAHFDCDTAMHIHFPAEGGFVLYSNPRAAWQAGDMVGCMLTTDSLTADRMYLEEYGFSLNANEGYLLYGKGDVTISFYDDEYASKYDGNLLKPSGVDGTYLEDLPTTSRYYIFKEDRFVECKEGFVEGNSAYLAVPTDSVLTNETLFITKGGLSTKLEEVKAQLKAAYDKGTWTIGGVRAPELPTRRGLYIKNGKVHAINR